MDKKYIGFKFNALFNFKITLIIISLLLTSININFDYIHFRDSSKGDLLLYTHLLTKFFILI